MKKYYYVDGMWWTNGLLLIPEEFSNPMLHKGAVESWRYEEDQTVYADSIESAARQLESKGYRVHIYPYLLNDLLKEHGLERVSSPARDMEIIKTWSKEGNRYSVFDRDNTYYYTEYRTQEGAIVTETHIVKVYGDSYAPEYRSITPEHEYHYKIEFPPKHDNGLKTLV